MDNQIVLIIGAGASKALHPEFALGTQLLKEISDRVTDKDSIDKNLSNLYKKLKIDESICKDFTDRLDEYRRNANPQSIDGFLNEVDSYPEFKDVREEFIKIGKFAIMFHILGYEAALVRANGLKGDAWINLLANYMNEKLQDSNNIFRDEIDLRIITFNYDRNIEHYLYQNEIFKDKRRALKSFLAKSVVHVYGKIGNLPWEGPSHYFEYGEANNREDKIFKARNSIDIMYMDKSANQQEAKRKARHWIHSERTRSVCAFGFNFDLINYRLLSLQNLGVEPQNQHVKLIANVFPRNDDLTFNDRREKASRIRNIKHDAEITYKDCSGFVSYVLNGRH